MLSRKDEFKQPFLERTAVRQKGFTLIELLVVIAIIAVLMAIIVPALKSAKNQAQSIVCLANLNGLSKAWTIYADDYNADMVGAFVGAGDEEPFFSWIDYPQNPNGTNVASMGDCTMPQEVRGIESGLLFPYVGNAKNYHCPADKRYLKPPTRSGYGGDGGYRTYSIVGGARGVWNTSLEKYITTTWHFEAHVKTTTIKSPGDKYMFVEENDGRSINGGSWVLDPMSTTEWVDSPSVWHYDRSTLGFADGHGEKHKWNDREAIKAAEEGEQYAPVTNQDDYTYMVRGYPVLRVFP
jgi:prepilin-type N-terminal cleavage/methylation domain-containing protein